MNQVTAPVLVFHHVPKTAGTSFRSWLWRTLGRERVFWHGEGEDGFIDDAVALRGAEYFDRIAVIGGHIPFSNTVLHSLPQQKVHAAMVRRPIDQVVSHFEYVSHLPDHPLYSGKNLEQALINDTPFLRDSTNMQTRYISNRETVFEAQCVFDENHFIIGCLDNISFFLSQISQLLHISSPEFPLENVQRKGYFESICTPRAARIISEITAQDQIIYQKVKENGVLSTLHS